MKTFINEFKSFIAKGNVMDLAVGVVIGSAFTSIVDSFVSDIISPVIGILTGGINFSGLSLDVGEATLTYGNFITASINFLIVAFALFVMVKAINKLKSASENIAGIEKKEAPAAPPTCPYCLEEVKKGATRCPHCGSELHS